jgi:DNA-binding beta-propeller fold protein YncE
MSSWTGSPPKARSAAAGWSTRLASAPYTQIGLTGTPIGRTGGLAFDDANNALYATFAANGGFYRIDPATGIATLVSVNRVDHGLAFAPDRREPDLFTYSVKFVCGIQREAEPHQTVVRPGVYATETSTTTTTSACGSASMCCRLCSETRWSDGSLG